MDSLMTMTEFGLRLTNTKGIRDENYEIEEETADKKMYGKQRKMYVSWNKENVINGLKKLHLLENDFDYVDDVNETSDME